MASNLGGTRLSAHLYNLAHSTVLTASVRGYPACRPSRPEDASAAGHHCASPAGIRKVIML